MYVAIAAGMLNAISIAWSGEAFERLTKLCGYPCDGGYVAIALSFVLIPVASAEMISRCIGAPVEVRGFEVLPRRK